MPTQKKNAEKKVNAAHRASYFIISLGCSKNLTDSERINAALESEGLFAAPDEKSADCIIINTCGFINDAKKESISVIFDALELRDQENKNGKRAIKMKVAVTGCLSQRYLDDIKKEIPEADLVYGIPDENFVLQLSELLAPGRDHRFTMSNRKPLDSGKAYEYIKVSDGCSNNCSYCAIPLIRGPIRSFSPDDILSDARSALDRGAKELVIVAQDIARYSYKGYSLPDLLKDLSSLNPPWVRLLYCHPDHLDEKIISAMKDIPGVLHYLDIPFQHVNRDILKAMNRTGNPDLYKGIIRDLRAAMPDIAIRSTFMTGFPGETDDTFEELLTFLDETRLDRVGCFSYSPEEGTPAAALESVESGVANERADRLMEFQRDISLDNLEKRIGTKMRVLVEEKTESGWIGRSEYDAPDVDGVFFLTGAGVKLHDIVTARVTDAVDYDLAGCYDS
jgi:ribosomal protein S12 methylthiotransferase